MEWAKVLMLLDFESGDLPAQVVDAKGHVPSSTIGTLAFDSSGVKYGNRSLKVTPAGALRYTSAARMLLGTVGVGSVDHVRIQLEYPNLVAYLNGVRITSPFPVSAAVGSTVAPNHQFGDASSGFAGKISPLRMTNKLRYAGPKFKVPSGPPAVEGPTNALIDDYILAEVVQ